MTNGSSLTMVGGSVYSNAVGVYVSSDSSLTVSGAVNISGNTTSNVYLDGSLITLGALTSGASIGVTTDTKPTANSPVQITQASESYYSTALQYFFSDSYLYVVCANDTGKYLELQLADYGMAISGSTTADTGAFGSICVDEAATQSFTITNTGSNAQLSGITVALSGDNAASFTLDTSALSTTLAVGGTTSFSVLPADGLTAGTYTATITVSANYVTAQTVDVTLTVTEHSWNTGEVTTSAACTTEGEMLYTCSACGATKTEVISATGHDWDSDPTVDTPATCTTEGSQSYHCKNCDATKDVTAIPATGHTTEIQNAKDATCTEDGYTGDEVCTVCGDTVTAGEVIPATGHTTEVQNAKAATCTEDGYTGDEVCTVCGDTVTAGEVIPATGHTTEIQNAKDATCTLDGYTGDEVCTVCGETITAGETIPATGHSYTTEVIDPTYTEQGYTLHTCETCGDSYMDDYTAILVLDGTDSSVTTQVTVDSLTSLDGELPNIYSSVDALTADLISKVTVTAGYTEENTAVYDVYLQYSVDGGTWVAATVHNFPTTGITVTLPYPDGTDASYSFTVLHMFTETSSRLGITAGETESPTVTKTDDGLVVTLTGLSPVAISWQAPTTTTTTTTTSPSTGDSSQIALWIALLAVSGVGIVGLTVYCAKRRRSR